MHSVLECTYSIFSSKLTLKKLYKLSKLGGGGEVIWTKSKRTAVFCRETVSKICGQNTRTKNKNSHIALAMGEEGGLVRRLYLLNTDNKGFAW